MHLTADRYDTETDFEETTETTSRNKLFQVTSSPTHSARVVCQGCRFVDNTEKKKYYVTNKNKAIPLRRRRIHNASLTPDAKTSDHSLQNYLTNQQIE